MKFSPAHVDALNARGETPMFYAVRASNKDVVALLLQLGADPGMCSVSLGQRTHKHLHTSHIYLSMDTHAPFVILS